MLSCFRDCGNATIGEEGISVMTEQASLIKIRTLVYINLNWGLSSNQRKDMASSNYCMI
jgi:hypothetical protein